MDIGSEEIQCFGNVWWMITISEKKSSVIFGNNTDHKMPTQSVEVCVSMQMAKVKIA